MDKTTFFIFATYIVPPTVLIPIVLGLVKYRALTLPFKIILGFVVFSGIMNLSAIVLIEYGHTTTTMVHIYTIFEFLFISLFYNCFYSKRKQNIIIGIAVFFAVLCIFNLFFIQNKIEFNTYTRSLGAIVIIIYALLFIFNQTNLEQRWSDNKYNWVNAGILLYFASCLFMFIFANYLLSASRSVNRIVWSIHDTILILEYILFAIGFNKCKTQQTISSY